MPRALDGLAALDARALGDRASASGIPLAPGERISASGRIEADPVSMPAEVRRVIRKPYIPKKHAGSTFDTFETVVRVDGDKAVTMREDRSLTMARAAVMAWTDAARAGRPAMLAVVGSQGNGKSHLLYAAAHALESAGVPVWCYPWYRQADALRYGGPLPWKPEAHLEGHELRTKLLDSGVILLDEVGATAGSEFDTNELRKIAGAAYDEGAAVLVTSNVFPLAEIMGPAAADRFAVVQITAPSRRQA
jgi:DNA replication protein DnaC